MKFNLKKRIKMGNKQQRFRRLLARKMFRMFVSRAARVSVVEEK